MAEGYLRFFTEGRVEIHSAGLQPKGVHPLAIAIMKDDNIDIANARSKDVAEFSGESFDYLITVCDHAFEQKPADIEAIHHLHFSIPDPDDGEYQDKEPFQIFYDTRELVKKNILRFIGQNYSRPVKESEDLEFY